MDLATLPATAATQMCEVTGDMVVRVKWHNGEGEVANLWLIHIHRAPAVKN